MEFFRRTVADINIENLVHNWNEIKKIANDERFICPMVKANAYGHGAPEVAKALEGEGAKTFGVCLIEEGLRLRAAGIKSEILVFSGFDKLGAEKILEYQMVPVVSSWEQLHSIESAADTSVKVHIKFDTGMNRLGFVAADAEKLRTYFKKSKMLKLKGLLTHLAKSEDCHDLNGKSAQQFKLFLDIQNVFNSADLFTHVLNSGGILSYSNLKSEKNNLLHSCKWGFRPGLLLYGYQPTGNFLGFDFKPVMTFKSVVNNIRFVEAGASVSYGATWVAAKNSYIAVIPVGYADGVHRQLSNSGSVLIAGHKLQIVGNVCMDFLMVDITDLIIKTGRDNWIDEEVIIFGADENNNFLLADEPALIANTISYELLTSVSHRVPRHFKGLKKS